MSQGKIHKTKQKSGGYNVAWLILVEAVAWNVLFPMYLIDTGLFVIALGSFSVALIVVATKETAPNYKAMSTEELLQYTEEQRSEREAYKQIPSKLAKKLQPKKHQKSSIELYNLLYD